jgi:hypothetical protein
MMTPPQPQNDDNMYTLERKRLGDHNVVFTDAPKSIHVVIISKLGDRPPCFSPSTASAAVCSSAGPTVRGFEAAKYPGDLRGTGAGREVIRVLKSNCA